MSWPRRLLFLLHLGFCVHCVRYLRQLRWTVDALGRVPAPPAADEVPEDLMQAFRDQHGG